MLPQVAFGLSLIPFEVHGSMLPRLLTRTNSVLSINAAIVERLEIESKRFSAACWMLDKTMLNGTALGRWGKSSPLWGLNGLRQVVRLRSRRPRFLFAFGLQHAPRSPRLREARHPTRTEPSTKP